MRGWWDSLGRSPDSVGRSLGFGRPNPGLVGGGRLLQGRRRGSCRRRRGRPCGGPGWRGWEPPPQSLRDSSPSGGAIGSGCSGGDSRLAGFGSRIGALRSAVAPPSGSCRRRRPCGGPGWRGWEPPPQSLRDSSPSGDLRGSPRLLRTFPRSVAPFGGGCHEVRKVGSCMASLSGERAPGAPLCLRHLPPRSGGSDWSGLFGGRLQAGRLWLLDRRAPFGGGSPRVGAAAGGGRAAAQVRLGASPSVAARQLPLGGSDWIGLFGRGLQAGRLRLADWRAPFGGGCLDR